MTTGYLTARLLRYCDQIESGEIPACQKHKWACQRFRRDLDRAGSWEWVFDESKANRYFDWMRLFKHSKGPLAGHPKEPCDYELFVYGNIYGWVHKDTGLRRFRRSYEQIARKNAKSQDKAIQALYEISAFGEPMAEAYVAATKKEQTRHVWGEAEWLYKNSDQAQIRDAFTCKFEQNLQQVAIVHKKSGSFFVRLSKDDKRSGDGANPHFLVIDEYHLHETTEYYDLGTSGMKTRAQPLLSIITTAGFELNNPCYRVEYDYVSKILDPHNPVENDRYFVMICELDRIEDTDSEDASGFDVGIADDIKDQSCWVKANPVIGTSDVGIESIGIDVAEAMDKPEKMRDVLTKTFNVWVNQRDAGYMNLEKWAACGASAVRPFPEVRGLQAFPGVDLSSTIDLTSVSFDIVLPDREYAVLSHSFIPEEKLTERRKSDKVPYDLWIRQGHLTATPGAAVDYDFVLAHMVDMIERYKLKVDRVCFDRALASWLMGQVQELGYTPVDVPQSYTGLSAATKDFRDQVVNWKVYHNCDPCLTWAMGNAIVRKGPSENIMLDKAKAKQRFDPVAALITAHTQAMVVEVTASSRVLFF